MKYFVLVLVLIGIAGSAFATEPQIIIVEHYMPDVELLPNSQVIFGETFTIHAWLPTYEEKPDLLRYYVHVRDSEGNQVDSTLWYAREDFVYEFDTTHPAYNITKGGKYFIKIEKADGMSPTGSYYKTLEFEIIKQTCRSDLFLAFRADESRTACVKPYTLDKLIERGWAKAHTDMGSLDVKPIKDAKIKYCPKDSRLIQGGYYVTDDSTLTVSQKRFDHNGWMVEFSNPEEYKQYAYVFVDCISDSPEPERISYPVDPESEQGVCDLGFVLDDGYCHNYGKMIEFTKDKPQFPKIDSLRPENRLQVKHSAGYTTVEITLSSWEEYNEWEESRGPEHEPMPPIGIGVHNMNPIVFDLLFEMWNFTDYEVSRYDNNLFRKTIQKDYSVPNHHGIHDWLESEFNKQYGEKKDSSFSNHFEFRDKVYSVTMEAVD